jgi:DNA-binding transcriptional ArsR family regulator
MNNVAENLGVALEGPLAAVLDPPLDPPLDMDIMRQAATKASGLLKALANPDRLLLLCQLSQGESCVSQLQDLIGIGQPTLSQQLGVLREERLVSTRREGKQIFYSIASKEALAVMQVLYQQFCKTETGENDD